MCVWETFHSSQAAYFYISFMIPEGTTLKSWSSYDFCPQELWAETKSVTRGKVLFPVGRISSQQGR